MYIGSFWTDTRNKEVWTKQVAIAFNQWDSKIASLLNWAGSTYIGRVIAVCVWWMILWIERNEGYSLPPRFYSLDILSSVYSSPVETFLQDTICMLIPTQPVWSKSVSAKFHDHVTPSLCHMRIPRFEALRLESLGFRSVWTKFERCLLC